MSEAAPKPMSFEHLGLEQGGGPAEIDRGNSKMRLLAVGVALMVLLPALIFFLTRPGNQPPGGTPETDRDTTSVVPDGPWPVYLDLAGNRTFRRENLTVLGDIIVREGASLAFEDCNLTINGTVFVQGSLAVRGCAVGEPEASDTYAVGYPGQFPYGEVLAFDLNLSGVKSASVDFKADHGCNAYETVYLQAVVGANRTRLYDFADAHRPPVRAHIDLDGFCGKQVRLEFDPSGDNVDFKAWGFELRRGGQNATAEALVPSLVGSWWGVYKHRDTYGIISRGGSVSIERSGLTTGTYTESGLVKAENSNITLNSTSVEFIHEENVYWVPGFIGGSGSAVSLSGCSLTGISGLDLTDSEVFVANTTFTRSGNAIRVASSTPGAGGARAVRVSDSAFRGPGLGIRVTNTALSVERTSFFDQSAVWAENDGSGPAGTVHLDRVDMEEVSNGLELHNITGAVENSTISAWHPLITSAPDTLTRGDCAMDDIVRLANNTITSEALDGEWPAVLVFSGIPVAGYEDMVRANSWGSKTVLERRVLLWQSTNAEFLGAGRRISFDAGMQWTAENRFIDPWQQVESSYPYNGNVRGRLCDGSLVADRIQSFLGDYILTMQDEKGINFRVHDFQGIGDLFTGMDRMLHPLDILTLSFNLREGCDLYIKSVDLTHDKDLGRFTFWLDCWCEGYQARQLRASFIAGDHREDRTVDDPYSYILFNLTPEELDQSHEMIISVSPVNVTDIDLTNNELRLNLTRVNASVKTTGPAALSGYYVLNPGVNWSFRDCVLAVEDETRLIGLGGNTFEMENCTVTGKNLSVLADTGRVSRVDVTPAQNETRRLRFAGDTWRIDNLTGGCAGADFERYLAMYRQAYLEEPYTFVPFDRILPCFGNGYTELSLYCHRLFLEDSRFFTGRYNYVIAKDLLDVARTTFAAGYYLSVGSGECTISSSSFVLLQDLVFSEGRMLIEGNSFSDVFGGVHAFFRENGSAFLNNTFTLGVPRESATLTVRGPGIPVLAGNLFIGGDRAILLECAGAPDRIVLENGFRNVTGRRAVMQKDIFLRFASPPFNASAGNPFREITVSFNDTSGPVKTSESAQHPQETENGTFFSTRIFPRTWALDREGNPRGLAELKMTITFIYIDGRSVSFERGIYIRDENTWSEDLR